MIYVYPCDEQTCAAIGWYFPVATAFLLYNLDTSRIRYVDSYGDVNDELVRFYKSTASRMNYRLPSHPPLYIYDPTQPEWQI